MIKSVVMWLRILVVSLLMCVGRSATVVSLGHFERMARTIIMACVLDSSVQPLIETTAHLSQLDIHCSLDLSQCLVKSHHIRYP